MRVVRAPSVDVLAAGLVRRLADHPPDDAMLPIDVAVPSRGMERWLTQRLSYELGASDGGDGVCANVRFPFPGAMVQRLVAAVLGDDVATEDPWAPQRLAWPLLAQLETLSHDPVNAPLWAHLTESGERTERRRYPLARRIADLFDRYAMYRPEMVRGWAEGGDAGPDGDRLPPNLAWQPPLWRALVERVGAPSLDARFRRAMSALAQGIIARPEDRPSEVTIFGVVSLPPLHLDLLAAIGSHVDVTIFAVTPCAVWTPDDPPPEPHQPLLASNGIAAVYGHAAFARHEPPGRRADGTGPAAGVDVDPDSAATALALLKADIHHDRRRGGPDHPAVPMAADDDSVQVHACHGPMRQLEVLREVLLGLLEDDHTLQPRDIVVLCPDIAAYDPIIGAVFSDGDRYGADASGVPTLPFRVADRTVRDENAAAQALLAVLDLVAARVSASEVVDLLTSAPVSARFGLSRNDLATLPTWVQGTGISWGIDARHRDERIGLDDATHTWRAGVDRLILGAAMPDDGTRMVGDVVPYDDMEGADVELLGRLAVATDALFTSLRSLEDRRPVAAWRQALDRVVDDLLDPGPGARSDAQLTRELAAVREALAAMVEDSRDADGHPNGIELTLEEARTVLGAHLGQPSRSATYGSGAITFAGLEPLRNVPHRVVCLVGLDDGALPRSTHRHGFDLIASHLQPGDPDPRVEDRQLLLDAILSAGDHLVVTYTGHDARTNEVQLPAVPISELLDVLGETLTVHGGSGEVVRARLVTSHPLQPHSPRYFRDAVDGEEEMPRAFDRRQLAAATTAAGARTPAPDFFPVDHVLPMPGEDDLDPHLIELADLIRFLEHPVRHLLQRRVGIALGEDDRRLEDRDPTELGGLERWKLGQDLLERNLTGAAPSRWRELTLARGTVPVGGIGEVALDGIEELVDQLCDRVSGIAGEPGPLPVDVLVALPGPAGEEQSPARLVGSVDLIGSTVAHVSVSTLKARHRIATWARLLAVTATRPALCPSARLIGRDSGLKAGYRDHTLRALADTRDEDDGRDPAALAAEQLAELVALYLRGHTEPVALLPEVSRAYADCRLHGKDHAEAVGSVLKIWEGNDRQPGEQRDHYVVQAFGTECGLADLAARTTFADDALRVWQPVITAEVPT